MSRRRNANDRRGKKTQASSTGGADKASASDQPADPTRSDDASQDPDLDAESVEDVDLDDADDASEEDDAEGPIHRRFVIRRDPKKRLDVYLQHRIKGVSRNQIRKLIDSSVGAVTVNDRPAKPSTNIRTGDVIDVILPPPPPKYLVPEHVPLDILYEDGDLIVVNKQAGLIVHPARSHLYGTLINGLAYHFLQQQFEKQGLPMPPQEELTRMARRKSDDPEKAGDVGPWGLSSVGADDARPGVVHRLDKNTTGAMVVAKRDQTHWLIAKQFEERKTLKAYLALVHGCFDHPGGVIDQPIGKHPTIREAYCVRHDSFGKPSVTIYRVRERYQGYSLVELELKTGRTHQIRVHLSYLGCPIVGDLVYGGEAVGESDLDAPPAPAGFRKHLNFARTREEGLAADAKANTRDDLILATPALHASLLSFKHPVSQQQMTFTAPLHEPMLTLVRRLRERPDDGPVATEGYWTDLAKLAPDAR